MNLIGTIALFGWPIVAILLAAQLRVPRAVVAGCVIAWLFLPEGGMDFPGPLDLSKINVTTLSVLAGVLLIEPRRVMALRPSLADVPIAVLCVSSFFSSLDNGLGAYDGLAESLAKTFTWGVPWLVGRACFNSIADLRTLALGIVLGGLVYLPLCLYEIRMSPQLHRMLYGFFPHEEFAQTRRFGGFRPNVFMQHGLAVGLWMCVSALTGAWLWHAGRLRALLRIPMSLLVPAQIAVAIACKSAGAVVLMFGGAGALLFSKWTRTRLALLALAAFPCLYVGYRVVDGPTDLLVDLVGTAPVLSERVDSLEYRIEAEGILLDHAMERPLFGWGGYGRHRPLNDDGEELARTDSLWVITLGQNGLLGLVSLYLALAIPLWMVARRVPAATITSPQAAPLLILAVLVALFACDSLFNAMFNPVYVMAGGGVVATMQAMRRPAPGRSGLQSAPLSSDRPDGPPTDAAIEPIARLGPGPAHPDPGALHGVIGPIPFPAASDRAG